MLFHRFDNVAWWRHHRDPFWWCQMPTWQYGAAKLAVGGTYSTRYIPWMGPPTRGNPGRHCPARLFGYPYYAPSPSAQSAWLAWYHIKFGLCLPLFVLRKGCPPFYFLFLFFWYKIGVHILMLWDSNKMEDLGSLHTWAKSRDHGIVRAQKKVSKGRPNTPSKIM